MDRIRLSERFPGFEEEDLAGVCRLELWRLPERLSISLSLILLTLFAFSRILRKLLRFSSALVLRTDTMAFPVTVFDEVRAVSGRGCTVV